MKRHILTLAVYLALIAGASAQPVPPGTNPLPVAGSYNTVAPTCLNTGFCQLQTDVNGQLKVTGTSGGGAATIADGADVAEGATTDAASAAGGIGTLSAKLRLMTTQLGTINTTLGSPFQVGGSIGNTSFQTLPGTTGGLSTFFLQPTASDNHAVIKAGAGQVYKISITNNQAVINYIRLYNATTGFNGCNSATNLVYENAIPGNTTATGIMDEWSQGMAFSTGISICVTSGYATTDTTNATASAMNVNIGYK